MTFVIGLPQIKETPYFQKRMSPPSEDRSAKFFSWDSDGENLETGHFHYLSLSNEQLVHSMFCNPINHCYLL